jgi:hypothetical protein
VKERKGDSKERDEGLNVHYCSYFHFLSDSAKPHLILSLFTYKSFIIFL